MYTVREEGRIKENREGRKGRKGWVGRGYGGGGESEEEEGRYRILKRNFA